MRGLALRYVFPAVPSFPQPVKPLFCFLYVRAEARTLRTGTFSAACLGAEFAALLRDRLHRA